MSNVITSTPVARVRVFCMASYETHLELPEIFVDSDGTIKDEEAMIEYINQHMDECNIESDLEYVGSSEIELDCDDISLGNVDVQMVDTITEESLANLTHEESIRIIDYYDAHGYARPLSLDLSAEEIAREIIKRAPMEVIKDALKE